MKESAKVLKKRILLAVIAGFAAVVPLAGMTALTNGPAGAQPPGIKCSAASGTVTGSTLHIHLAVCTGTTGASGHTMVTSPGGSWRIKWANLDKTHFTYTTGPWTRCPVASVADVVVTGTVTSDNTSDTTAGAALSGEFCVSASLTIALAPGTKFVIAG
jgi:hypothetical protein